MTSDGRTRIKARHRAAILDAAEALLVERRGVDFTVGDLADRADVARRTVFNHFVSLDDVVLAVCSRVLAPALADLRATIRESASSGRADGAGLEPITNWLRHPAIPAAVRGLLELLPPARTDPRIHWLTLRLSLAAADDLADVLASCYPGAHPERHRLLADSTVHGLTRLGWHWVTESGPGRADAPEVWAAMVDMLTAALGAAHAVGTRR